MILVYQLHPVSQQYLWFQIGLLHRFHHCNLLAQCYQNVQEHLWDLVVPAIQQDH